MRTRTLLSTKILLVFLIGYLVYLPTGPYPFYIGGVRVEYALFGLMCAASLLRLNPVFRQLKGPYGRAQACVLLYLLVITFTTMLSSQFNVSLRALLTTIGYAYLACVLPPLVYRHIGILRQALLWFAGVTTVILVYLYLALGYGGEQRFTLADRAARSEADTNYVDPNMTAIGMVMCVIIAFPLLFGAGRGRWLGRTVNRIIAVAVVGGALFFESRTAALSLLLGVAFGFVRAGAGVGHGRKVLKRAALVVIVLLIGAVANRNEVSVLMGRLENIDEDTASSSGRITLFEDAVQDWASTGKTMLLGNGYYVSNPHNEFLRTLACDGLVGLVAFTILLWGIYTVCCRGRRYTAEETLNQNVLFGFIVAAMMTYGHTKTMWLAFMFLLIGYFEAQTRDLAARNAIVPQMAFAMPGSEFRVNRFPVPTPESQPARTDPYSDYPARTSF